MSDNCNYLSEAKRFIKAWKEDIPEFEAYTSGSTGAPKRIMLPRRLMEESALRSIRHFSLDANSTLHLCLSPAYIAGKMCIVRALMSGARLTMEEPSSSPLTSQTTPHEITLLSVVGAQIEALYSLKQEGRLPVIKHLLLGGSPLTPEMRDKTVTLAEQVWESYGMTETASHIALRRVNTTLEPFYPLPDIKLTTDSRGCLVIDMPTAGHIVTNDIADILPDGRFHILGRADNVIISGGLKVIPERVESVLAHYINQPFYISSIPHPKWGEQVVMICESTHELSQHSCRANQTCIIDASEYGVSRGLSLKELTRKLLQPHERPARVIIVPEFQRTASHKLIRIKHTVKN